MNRFIDEFYLRTASYYVTDGNGNKVQLRVNYWRNKIRVKELTKVNDKMLELRKRSEQIGQILLERKHRANFADKYENL